MQQLAEEEQKEEMERQQQTELERKFRRRIEARQAHRDQMADRMKRLQQEAQDEARYKQQVNMYEDIGNTLHDLIKSCYYFLHPLTYIEMVYKVTEITCDLRFLWLGPSKMIVFGMTS